MEYAPPFVILFIKVVGSAFVPIIGLICGWLIFRVIPYAVKSRKWPITNGKIVDRHIEVIKSGGEGESYKGVIEYMYEVGGNSYISNNIYFGGFWCKSKRDAKRDSQRYRQDQPVEVRYKPDNPEVAVVEPGLTIQLIGSLLVLLCVLVYLCYLVYNWCF